MAAEPMTTDHTTGVGLEPQSPQPTCRADDGDADSLSSLSDHLTIWVDGEEHWISGVDDNTTCADLIWALLNYQNNPQSLRKPTWNQEYAIVQKLQHYEEYLDGGARLVDVISKRHASLGAESQLQLRHLGPASTGKHPAITDKDSGMGSPVESSRSVRFRRRGRHKGLPLARVGQLLEGEQWGEYGTRVTPKQPKRSRKLQVRNGQVAPNETLLTTILAQDETILQQMSMLHEKDRQIRKIEEEKHLVREREMGKNYLLETYLKDLEEQEENAPQVQDLEEGARRLHQDRNIEIAEEPACKDDGSVTDEMRLFWLEKIHAVNKQLQREEERLLSLHAKVRRHHVKRAYQSKSEVLQHIDRLDSELAAQVADILQVERKLFTANEQLKAKLGVLECLGREFETSVAFNDKAPSELTDSEDRLTKLIESCSQHKETKNDLRASSAGQPVLEDHLPKPSRIQCLSQQELTDKNLNDRHVPDKGLSKQMFMEEPSTSTTRPTRLEKCYAPALYTAGTDIQHLGTLV